MRKKFAPPLVISLVVAVLWIGLGGPSQQGGTASQPSTQATEFLGSSDQIAQTKIAAPAKSAKTHPGTSDGGYHFQLSEPPLPFLNNYGSPTTTGEEDISAVSDAMAAYLSALPEMERPPTGTNAEFTRVLSGDNPLHVAFISQTHIVNGELTDRWGTPLFFHNVSSHQIDISSAGPDKKFQTPDDVSTNPGL